MSETFLNGKIVLHCGDCLEVLATLPECSVDSVVTDPPYHLVSIVKRFANEKPWDVETNFANRKLESQGVGPFARAARGFMGKVWDGGDIAFRPETWGAVLRVLKPGGHLLAFGGTRTSHRVACAIEDAGFEIRDTIMWLYGSGFPKSYDVSKGIDRARRDNADWLVVGRWLREQRESRGFKQKEVSALWPSITGGLTGCVANWELGFACPMWDQWLTLKDFIGFGDEMDVEVWRLNGRKGMPGDNWKVIGEREAPCATGGIYGDFAQRVEINDPTDAARQWEGWGTALKPAVEPIVLARKPLSEGTVAANVLRWGTGAINIKACRVPSGDGHTGDDSTDSNGHLHTGGQSAGIQNTSRRGTSIPLPSADGPHLTNGAGYVPGHQPPLDSLGDCHPSGHSGGEHARPAEDGDQASFPQQADGPGPLCPGATEPNSHGHLSTLDGPEPQASATTPPESAGATYIDSGLNLGVRLERTSHGDSLNGQEKHCADDTTPRIEKQGRRPGGFGNVGADKGDNRPNGFTPPEGRWPANVIHDGSEEVVAAFPETASRQDISIKQSSASENNGNCGPAYGRESRSAGSIMTSYGDSGSAARFFYTAKADADDRLGSKHPTVKPLDLMQYLVRLVTPPRGTVLDPFAGTGTTGEAAWREGMAACLIEREPEYQADIRRRMALALAGPDEKAHAIVKAKGLTELPGPLFEAIEYDAHKDVEGSFNEAYRVIRERVAAGGPGWTPRCDKTGDLFGEEPE